MRISLKVWPLKQTIICLRRSLCSDWVIALVTWPRYRRLMPLWCSACFREAPSIGASLFCRQSCTCEHTQTYIYSKGGAMRLQIGRSLTCALRFERFAVLSVTLVFSHIINTNSVHCICFNMAQAILLFIHNEWDVTLTALHTMCGSECLTNRLHCSQSLSVGITLHTYNI